MDNNLTPTPASEWGSKVAVAGTDLRLPSDNVARVRNLSPQAFLASGMIPDPLFKIIQDAIASGKGLPPSTMKKLSDDKASLIDTLMMFDRVLCFCVIEPQIKMPPPCSDCGEYFTDKHSSDHDYREGARDPEVLYADQVVMDDKVFIFQWALGGVKDLQSFREEQASLVASIPDGQGVQRSPKRSGRATKR
jgi:hypothetical protein